MLMGKPIQEMLDSIATGLEGSKITVQDYFFARLCEDPWEFLSRVTAYCLEKNGLICCEGCGRWTRDYCGSRLCPPCEEASGGVWIDGDAIARFWLESHQHDELPDWLKDWAAPGDDPFPGLDVLNVPVRRLTLVFKLEPNHELPSDDEAEL